MLRRVLGIEVTERDDGSAPRMEDVLFRLPDGRTGALEVTTIGDQAAIEGESIAGKWSWHVDGAKWTWMVHVGPGVQMLALKRHLATLLLACERHGVNDPRLLPYDPRRDDAANKWFESSDVSMHGFATTRRPGAIDVLPSGGGGAAFDHLDGLPSWLADRLRAPDLLANVEKLRASARDELRLFLRVHDTGIPFSLYDPLAFSSVVPTSPLDVPQGLSGVWLAPAWRNPILWWGARTGWRRADCLDAAPLRGDRR